MALILAISIAVFHYYYNSKNKEKVSFILTFFRFLSLFLIFLLFINPKIERLEIENIKPVLSVAIDNSSSIKEIGNTEEVRGLLSNFKSNKVLNQKFDIQYYSFGEKCAPLDSLTFDEKQTDISKPLKLFSEVQKNASSGIVLVSDGNQTYGRDYEFLDAINPVYTVIVGDTTKYVDIAVSQLNVNRYAYLENKFPVEVYLNYTGENELKSTFSLFESGQSVYSEKLVLNAINNSKKISFYIPTKKVGTHFYTARVSSFSNEKNLENNTKSFVVEVIDEQSKTLLISSIRHPDIGSLKLSIESNKQRKVAVKLINETYNLEDYQSIILYQPTSSFKSLFEALKKQKINFGIITGTKTDWKFLNSIQSNFSKKAINQTENFQAIFNESFGTFSQRNIGFESFPPLEDFFGDVKINVQNEILLWQGVSGFVTEQPLLVTFEENDIRSFALFGEHSWKWRMSSNLDNQSFKDYDDFISRMMQYVSTKRKLKRLSIESEPIYYTNEDVEINAKYLDKNYQFDPNASLWLILIHKETSAESKIPFSNVGNSYVVEMNGLKIGDYSFSVSVEKSNLKLKGKFKLIDFNVEQQFSSANLEKLKILSSTSKGEAYFLDQQEKLMQDLLADDRFTTIQKSYKKFNELIEWQWLLGLIILSLSIEWFVRKYNGLI